MNTKYIYNQKEKCVQIERTYQLNLNITKDRKTIIIQKERLTSSQESESHFTHDTHFKLTGADVDKQLSNVKHIGFEVTVYLYTFICYKSQKILMPNSFTREYFIVYSHKYSP